MAPVVTLNYAIPDDLHRRVKIAAAEQGVTVKAFLLEALEAAVSEHERSKGRPKRRS